MFSGLSAFPLTPLRDGNVDESAFIRLVERLAASGVDSITALGPPGCFPYMKRSDRRRVARLAVEHADGKPVLVGISALRTSRVLALAEDAQEAGAAGVLLSPIAYQHLTDDDVFGLYADVARHLSVPLVVDDNPTTAQVALSDALYSRIATLPQTTSIKIPSVPADAAAARARIDQLRAILPSHVTIGISQDARAAFGLNAGCDGWYSEIAGILPELALPITRAAFDGYGDDAVAYSALLAPLWNLFEAHGSVRVIAALAELFGLAHRPSLPRPLRGLDDLDRARLRRTLIALDLFG